MASPFDGVSVSRTMANVVLFSYFSKSLHFGLDSSILEINIVWGECCLEIFPLVPLTFAFSSAKESFIQIAGRARNSFKMDFIAYLQFLIR